MNRYRVREGESINLHGYDMRGGDLVYLNPDDEADRALLDRIGHKLTADPRTHGYEDRAMRQPRRTAR